MARRFVDINFRANRFENARLASRGKQEGRTKRQSARHTDSSRRKERARVISSGRGEKEQVCQCCLHGEYSRNNYNAISGAENMSGWKAWRRPREGGTGSIFVSGRSKTPFASINGLAGERIKPARILSSTLVRFDLRPPTN